ncbi:MAG: malto-oligosyltrehalose trehalohydrolase [Betaproteobacteria bacterium RIFCSPLOWO2_12_FULL_68_19]|nr:MAG: malto-oligosyltrehalose trehalohydrolase [Betaproteobacteria bacterium RIFCSPLOWO2_12_FULL_68_19]
MRRQHAMPFGAELRRDGGTRFRLWAPAAARVELELLGPAVRALAPMQPAAGGWHEVSARDAPAGTHYRFVLDSGLAVPDPASRRNPLDVHGPSEVVDPGDYEWQDGAWRGRPWEDAVLYELHVGAFTAQGTFAAARERLPELAALGITAIELMPVAEFPGTRNWGYDGVLPFAPDASYGTPQDLKALVERAHALGMMMLLDVVYNHFGPEGNYLHAYCPPFFNAQHPTPWGAAINFDGEGNRTVRDFFVHNALYWIEEFHFDGLRLDAVHAIRDASPQHIVCEIAGRLHDGPGRERHVHLVLENDANEAHYLERGTALAPLCATAQWNDDLHHAAHVLVTGERDGYYADYADAPLARLGRALAEGFVYQGDPSAFRNGATRGEPSAQLPPTAFVSFLQTHDQVGNRALGERLHALAGERQERTALACLLLSPHIPMLFMGEEFAASTPFLFFCDFGPDLAQAVTEGRRREFARFAAYGDEASLARIPDPGSAATFTASKLRWGEREQGAHRARLALVRELLALRHRHLVPRLKGAQGGGRLEILNGALRVEWALGDGSRLRLLAHFGAEPVTVPPRLAGEVIYCDGVRPAAGGNVHLEPGAVRVLLASADVR